ncbi:MAG: TPM domain-containing protein [Lachnospiraceae bacterium]|nr:TPM domain-containing protein [Lachnospiraceae bacterium]
MSENKSLIKFLALTQLTILFFILPNDRAFAYEPVYVNVETGYEAYIIDDEDLLSEEEETALLNDYLRSVTNYGGAAFVSTSSSDAEKTAADYCYELFNNESGTTLCIDMGDRRIAIMSSGEIYKHINKSYGYIITDNIYGYATKGDYFGCAEEGFNEIVTVLYGERIAQPMRYISTLLLAVVFALLFNFMYVWMKKGKVSVDSETLIAAAAGAVIGTAVGKNLVSSHKTRHSSGSGGGSGGGGGGGGFSGGGGSHSF